MPEAIWFEPGGKRELLYLRTRTSRPTGTRRTSRLEPLEWTRQKDGSLRVERTLPNKVAFGTKVVPGKDGVRMEFWVTNG